ncbi:hypothetical protein FHL15_010543 [Xylaria flabelliformis]|uniref:Nephrocystin 3-like N-terminal domain-containing protein n=1 Tax=Xylaria flabelliformis TaxID=2512241 RepID=A0A553HKX2_9PEZI|nr:hypothetical protein FHL15_010543 [Xylaria flabelliformis]
MIQECSNFVSQDSTSLDASYEMGLYRTHRDLVRFKRNIEPVKQAVKGPLKRIIQSAPRIVRARFICTRQTAIDPKTLQDILSGLRGVDMQMKYEDLSDQLSEKPGILEEPEYQKWLELSKLMVDDYLWICGSEEKGKITAAVATIRAISSRIKDAEDQGSTRRPDLAYFFCEQIAGRSTAEDMLKSVFRQLSEQEQVPAIWAKQFIDGLREDKGYNKAIAYFAGSVIGNRAEQSK